jgi:nicotinate-nucleotide adenylyltransferase
MRCRQRRLRIEFYGTKTMKELGVMGGYFNPIHNWHLLLGDCAAHQFKLDKVLYIPSGEPPHEKKDKLDGNTRFRLVEAGIAGNALFEASRIEIDRPGVTWSIDTLRELKAKYGDGVRLNFIIGEDNIKAIAGYDKRAELAALCRLLVACRGEADPAQLAAWRAAVPEAEIEAIDCPVSDLASTLVRDRRRAGQPYRYLVPTKVYELIEELGLYLPPGSQPAEAPAA